MLLSMMGTGSVDGTPMVKDFQINFAGNHRARIRMEVPDRTGAFQPLDLIVQNFTTPSLDKLAIGMSFRGVEQVHRTQFDITVRYHFLKKTWTIIGVIGQRRVNVACRTFPEFVANFNKLF